MKHQYIVWLIVAWVNGADAEPITVAVADKAHSGSECNDFLPDTRKRLNIPSDVQMGCQKKIY